MNKSHEEATRHYGSTGERAVKLEELIDESTIDDVFSHIYLSREIKGDHLDG